MGLYLGSKVVRLPVEYQEVEYIASSGTQYINTGYEVQSNYKLETLVKSLTTGGNNVLYGTTKTAFTWGSPLCFTNNDQFIVGTGNSSVNINPVSLDIDYELTATLTSVILNGTTYSVSSSTTGGKTLTLFGGNSNFGQLRMYYFKIYNGTTLVRDLVPCYRIADDVIGMYDLVNNVFYTNSGSGTFIKGPNISDYKQFKEIYKDGSYFKKVYVGSQKVRPLYEVNSNTKLYIPFDKDFTNYGSSITVTPSASGAYKFNNLNNVLHYCTCTGSEGALNLSENPIGTGNPTHSLSCRVKLSSTGFVQTYHIGKDSNNSRAVFLIDTYRPLQDRYGSGYDIWIGSAIPNELRNVWFNIAYVHDGSDNIVYINGEYYASASGSLNINSASTNYLFSSFSNTSGCCIAQFILEGVKWNAEYQKQIYDMTKHLFQSS